MPRELRAGSGLGILSIIALGISVVLIWVKQKGDVTLPWLVITVVLAVVGFSMTICGTFRRRPRGWVPFFVIGFLCNGAILALVIAWAYWFVFIGVPG